MTTKQLKRTRRAGWNAALVALVTVPCWVQMASAQTTPDPQAGTNPQQGNAGPGGPAPGGPAGGATAAPTSVFTPFGVPAAAATNTGPIGGGNATDSSSRPLTGNQEDSFDIPQSGTGTATVHGAESGPIYLPHDDMNEGGEGVSGGDAPNSYTVRKGDTLWGICDQYLKNPYQWPRIWSYNPQVQNPHWVYPGDELSLRPRGAQTGMASAETGAGKAGSPQSGAGGGQDVNFSQNVAVNPTVERGIVSLRDEGFIDDSADENWGMLSGSPLDHMLLSNEDEAYLQIDGSHEPQVGQELTLFHPIRAVSGGRMIQIIGTVRVDQWNPKERVARAKVIESLDVIERGALVGPVGRTFALPPRAINEHEVRAHVIASVHPHNFWGQNQVVFIDKGSDDGLALGNRLSIVRQGDAWRQSLVHEVAGLRISAEAQDQPPVEKTPGGDSTRYPEESFGELRVVGLKRHTATCLLTQTNGEVEVNDVVVAKPGR